MNLFNASVSDLKDFISDKQRKLEEFKSQNLKLDMSRGKPCPEQLDLSSEMLSINEVAKDLDGTDLRNYGGLEGIREARQLFGEMIGAKVNETLIGGNSSLSLMYDTISRAMLLGVLGSDVAWSKLSTVKFLCPSPGYDRHFAICELLGIEMITVDMLSDGPDMDTIEKLLSEDESIKGIWCVPMYSNPDGITYSDKVVARFANLKPKAKDFRIIWDNAYAVHHLTDSPDKLVNILEACKNAGNPDMVFVFSSTSKISFPGAGVSLLAASEANINFIKKQLSIQTIGPDKTNQMRHVQFLKSVDNISSHMRKHATILAPKFSIVLDTLDKELKDLNIATWNSPNGGYFISLNTLEGCAKKVVAMAKDAGVTLTNAGATFPYGKDPRDRNIRIAPTFPSLLELQNAILLLCICIQLVSAEKALEMKEK